MGTSTDSIIAMNAYRFQVAMREGMTFASVSTYDMWKFYQNLREMFSE